MKRCTKCVLPESFPGIQFDEGGVCQYCRKTPDQKQQAARKARLRQRFEAVAADVRARPGYHCLMAWSGGKDSTYTLWLLQEEYRLRTLTFTFDNGFISAAALKNMRVVAENLGVDHVIVKPNFNVLREIFVACIQDSLYPPRALERASCVCNACMGLAKGIGLRMALEKEIPFIAYGWSPGQVPLASALFHTNHRMLEAMVKTAKAPLAQVTDAPIDDYFPTEAQLDGTRETPYNVSPLAFTPYDEETAVRTIHALGWDRPQDTDPNSTNCLLNSYANLIHQEQTGYHPYAMELGGLVREGYLDRDAAMDKLSASPLPAIVAAVKAKLNLAVL
jgi:hypothetical protein